METQRRTDAHLAALIEQTIAGIAETDLTGRFILVNDRYCEITGYARDELLAGSRMQDITHGDDRPSNLALFERLVAAGEPFVIEKRYVRKDGALAWVHNSVSAIRDHTGRISSVLAVVIDITERTRAEGELRSNVTRFRALADATATAIWTVSPMGEVLDQAAVRWSYLTDVPDDELAAEWLAAVHPDDREPGNASWRAGIAAGMPFEFEQRVRRRDGTYRHFIVRAVPVRKEDGLIQEWVGADVDVTERKRAEAAVRQSERRLQALSDAMPHVVWAADPDGTVRYYNSRVSGFGGVVHPGPGVWDWQPTLHPDDLAATVESWQRAVRDSSSYTQEHRILMADGQYRWHLSRAEPILDAAGRIETWYGTATDVHDLKHAEIAVRENEERLRVGIDVAGFALLEIDYDAGVIHLSAEAAHLYGLGIDAVTFPRDRVHATFHPDDRNELLRRISLPPDRPAAEPYTTEYRVVWPAGEVRWLSVRKQVIFGHDGPSPRPRRAIVAALDITARKQAEADRQALLDALAHDLRNPLTALKMQTQLLLRQFERGHMPDRDVLAERTAGFLELANRMTGLIDDLEEHAHLGIGGGGAPDRQATDLVALARTSVAELQQSGDLHGIRLDTDESELVGFWDPLHVRRILDNLLGNAMKYSLAGSDVQVHLFRAGRSAVIEVRDEGIGIPAADLPHIFAFRHRGGNVGSVAGSGVGLAGVKQIVERHGGTVTAQSEEGRGSVFTVRLPLLVSGR